MRSYKNYSFDGNWTCVFAFRSMLHLLNYLYTRFAIFWCDQNFFGIQNIKLPLFLLIFYYWISRFALKKITMRTLSDSRKKKRVKMKKKTDEYTLCQRDRSPARIGSYTRRRPEDKPVSHLLTRNIWEICICTYI